MNATPNVEKQAELDRLIPRLQNGEDVALYMSSPAAFGDRDFAAAGDNAFERREPDEGVAAYLLAALN